MPAFAPSFTCLQRFARAHYDEPAGQLLSGQQLILELPDRVAVAAETFLDCAVVTTEIEKHQDCFKPSCPLLRLVTGLQAGVARPLATHLQVELDHGPSTRLPTRF